LYSPRTYFSIPNKIILTEQSLEASDSQTVLRRSAPLKIKFNNKFTKIASRLNVEIFLEGALQLQWAIKHCAIFGRSYVFLVFSKLSKVLSTSKKREKFESLNSKHGLYKTTQRGQKNSV
jgi:hypothetical protein